MQDACCKLKFFPLNIFNRYICAMCDILFIHIKTVNNVTEYAFYYIICIYCGFVYLYVEYCFDFCFFFCCLSEKQRIDSEYYLHQAELKVKKAKN